MPPVLSIDARQFFYIHWNSVKHGEIEHVVDWPYSSFHKFVKLGVYSATWGDLIFARLNCSAHPIELTDAIARLLADEQVLTYRFEGKRYDCGSKLGYLMANVEHGLLHDELRDEFQAYLKQLVNKF